MASEKRQHRVAEQIRKDLGQILMTEHGDLFAKMTFSEVRLSTDLSHAKIFVSIRSTGQDQEIVLKELMHRNKSIRRSLASKLRIRAVPLLRFLLDESLDRAETVGRLLEELNSEREETDDQDPDTESS
jgi:ribosome-binding factor A